MQKDFESSLKESMKKMEKIIEKITDPVLKSNLQKEYDELKKKIETNESIYHA
jgi:hypothetical protein